MLKMSKLFTGIKKKIILSKGRVVIIDHENIIIDLLESSIIFRRWLEVGNHCLLFIHLHLCVDAVEHTLLWVYGMLYWVAVVSIKDCLFSTTDSSKRLMQCRLNEDEFNEIIYIIILQKFKFKYTSPFN